MDSEVRQMINRQGKDAEFEMAIHIGMSPVMHMSGAELVFSFAI